MPAIAAFLNTYCGLPFCTECLERECELAAWQTQSAVERLARRPEFARSDWWCALCLTRRLVIETRDDQGLIDRLTRSP